MAERYDPRDVRPSRVLIVAAGGVATVALFLVAIGWFLRSASPVDGIPTAQQPSSPPLSVSLPAERTRMQAATEADLHHFGWVNREQGIAHIPIEEAEKLFIAHGWPQ